MKIEDYITADGFLYLRVIPNANETKIVGLYKENIIKIRVQGVPEKGKVNKNIIDFLSNELGIAKKNIKIVSGLTTQNKKLFIDFSK